LSAGAVTLIPGQSATCTITYDDIAPKLTVVMNVLSEHGGNAQPNDFSSERRRHGRRLAARRTRTTATPALTIQRTQLTGYQFVSLSAISVRQHWAGTVTPDPWRRHHLHHHQRRHRPEIDRWSRASCPNTAATRNRDDYQAGSVGGTVVVFGTKNT